MAQNISFEDLLREVRVALTTENGMRFCGAHKGMDYCDRYDGHNGKHAVALGYRLEYGKPVCDRVARF